MYSTPENVKNKFLSTSYDKKTDNTSLNTGSIL